jgi:hypothetical protein
MLAICHTDVKAGLLEAPQRRPRKLQEPSHNETTTHMHEAHSGRPDYGHQQKWLHHKSPAVCRSTPGVYARQIFFERTQSA